MANDQKIYDMNHNPVGSVALAPEVFNTPLRSHLVHQVVKGYLANKRMGTAAVKSRSLVSGGGKKPWRQKGTGRARAGSTRSPLWKGGGTIFGPQPKDYWSRIPKRMRHEALKAALSDRVREGKLVIIDNIQIPDGKTKSFCAVAKKMEWTGALVVGEKLDAMVKRAARNVPGYKVIEWTEINALEVLRYPSIVLTKGAVDRLSERLS